MNAEPNSEMVLIGYIARPVGLSGEVRVKALADLESLLDRKTRVEARVRSPRGEWRACTLTIARCRVSRDGMCLAFDEIRDRTGAEKLKNAELRIARESLPDLEEEDAWYEADLLGCQVHNTNGGELGVLEEIIETGANDIYRVMKGETETLIPAVKAVVREIDLEHGIITVEWPPPNSPSPNPSPE